MSGANLVPQGFWRRVWFWIKFLEIRLRFVVALALTGLVVGYWENIQNYYERWQRERSKAGHHAIHNADMLAANMPADSGSTAPSTSQADSDEEYFCPMHPFVVRDVPGKCPICGMSLSRRKKGGAHTALPEGVSARIQVSPERIMQAGVKVEPVEYRNMVRTVRSYGLIEPDERLLARLIARFPGRIDELKVRSAGESVKAGDLVARIYSPEYYALAGEYLIAWRSWKKAEGTPEESRARGLMELPRRRLALAGYTEAQFREIEQADAVDDHVSLYAPATGIVIERNVLEGDMVEAGSPLFTIADFSRVWIQAQIIESEESAIKTGMPVEITLAAYPGEIFWGVANFIYPTVTPETRTVKVRVEIENADGRLRPGMYAMLAFRSPIGRVELVTPADMPGAPPSQSETPVRYWCPMHPEVQSDKPGVCEKCDGMDLFLMTPEEYARYATNKDSTKDPAKDSARAGLDTTSTLNASHWIYGWSCDMHPAELESKPGICTTCGCGMELLPRRVEGVLAVPEEAVIDTGLRKIVYAEFAEGIFDAREVVLGPRVGEYYQVLKGLEPGQKVAARGAFLIDAETRLNPASVASVPEASASTTHSH